MEQTSETRRYSRKTKPPNRLKNGKSITVPETGINQALSTTQRPGTAGTQNAEFCMDQSNRYTDLSLNEPNLISGGQHVLVAYTMKPRAGHSYLGTAAHFAAESSTGTNVEVSTADDFTRSVDAIVYHANKTGEFMKIAYPITLFDRNIVDGLAMISSFLTLVVGNNQGMDQVEYSKMIDFYIPPDYLKLFEGPGTTISELWQVLKRPEVNGGFITGAIVKPKLGLKPRKFAQATYEFWLGGDFIKNDEPQGNQPFAPFRETIRQVAESLEKVQQKTGEPKLFSANITADDHDETIARGEFILEAFGENANHVAFMVDGYTAGPSCVKTVRKYFPDHFLHYHRAGHGAVTSRQSRRGYSAFALCKMARLLGTSGIHTGTMGFGKMEGQKEDRKIAFMLENDAATGPCFHQEWLGMKPTSPIISGGMNALRIPGFFNNLGHSNLIMTAGDGVYGHIDGATSGALSLRQAEQCWKAGADPVEFARDHREFARAFESFPRDADTLFPGWRAILQSEH